MNFEFVRLYSKSGRRDYVKFHLVRRRPEHYSHIQTKAKREVLEVAGVNTYTRDDYLFTPARATSKTSAATGLTSDDARLAPGDVSFVLVRATDDVIVTWTNGALRKERSCIVNIKLLVVDSYFFSA